MSEEKSAAAFAELLEEMTVEEVKAFAPQVVVLPLGYTEPHGPHLPMGTDTYQVTRLCRLAVEQGNSAAIDAALRKIAGMDDMPFVCWTWGMAPPGFVSPIEHDSDHGGESETSRMMYIRPKLVCTEELVDNPRGQLRVKALAQTRFVRPWHLYVPASAGGETRASSANKGRAVIEAEAEGLSELLAELSQAPYE